MESSSDSLLLSYKDNPELLAALGDKQPGDSVTLTIQVTVRANDEEHFDALIDNVETSDSETAEPDEGSDEEEAKDAAEGESSPAIALLGKRKKKDAAY